MPSAWLQHLTKDVTPEAVISDATLLFGSGGIASPLWSLQWEIVFSLALPAFAWAAVRSRRFSIPVVSGCIAVIAVGALGHGAIRFMPMFLIGAVLAANLSNLRRLKTAVEARRYSNVVWVMGLALSIVLLEANWLLQTQDTSAAIRALSLGLATLGALGIVTVAACWRSATSLLETRPVQGLGLISFSLYLTHEPIVIASAYFFGPGHELIALAVSIPLALVVAQVFRLTVERPGHRLAKKVGWRIDKRRAPSTVRSQKQPLSKAE